jgi:hypothetical protein
MTMMSASALRPMCGRGRRNAASWTCLPKSGWGRPRIPPASRRFMPRGWSLTSRTSRRPGPCFVDEVVVAIPSLGHYKARRLRRNGARAAYLFELTEFSRRALGALIADRFPD